MYEIGNEPFDFDEKKPHGFWGTNPNADIEGECKPSDLWFYPPNEKLDPGLQPAGKWTFPTNKDWPPRRVSTLEIPKMEYWAGKSPEKKKTSVGKLTIPKTFAGS